MANHVQVMNMSETRDEQVVNKPSLAGVGAWDKSQSRPEKV